jgi:ribonuclease P protein component
MAQSLVTIKKRSTFVYVRDKGKFIRSNSFNIQIFEDQKLDKIIAVGYTATKKLGNAIIRNKSKRIMRELAKKVIIKYGKINFYYVLIAKTSLLKKSFKDLELELKKIII